MTVTQFHDYAAVCRGGERLTDFQSGFEPSAGLLGAAVPGQDRRQAVPDDSEAAGRPANALTSVCEEEVASRTPDRSSAVRRGCSDVATGWLAPGFASID